MFELGIKCKGFLIAWFKNFHGGSLSLEFIFHLLGKIR